MKSHFFLSSSEVNYKSCRDVAEGIKFVGLAKTKHIPDESLFVGNFSVKFEMVEAEAVFTQFVVFEPGWTLGPLEHKSLGICGLG